MSVAVTEALRDHRVVVVGLGADGWASLTEPARHALRLAGVIIGGQRHLDALPEEVSGERLPWPSPLRPAVGSLMRDHRDQGIVVLASGDPMHFGVGKAIVEDIGAEAVHIVPHPSSVSLACARLGWPVESVEVRSAVGRDPSGLLSAVFPGARVLVLCPEAKSVGTVTSLLCDAGYGPSSVWVLGDLGTQHERVTSGVAHEWREPWEAQLTMVAIEGVREDGEPRWGVTPGLPDDAFDHDGQITKAHVRALTLAALAPRPGELLWDVGGGAGSVAIEWMRAHRRCRAVSIEANVERADRIRANARQLGVPALDVIQGRAPAALHGLDDPHAVFVGGGVTTHGLLPACWRALRPGGRLVVNAVTVESEAVLTRAHHRLGGTLTRLTLEHAEPIGRYRGWKPARPIVQWVVDKPLSGADDLGDLLPPAPAS